jgi:hypothetical protein
MAENSRLLGPHLPSTTLDIDLGLLARDAQYFKYLALLPAQVTAVKLNLIYYFF